MERLGSEHEVHEHDQCGSHDDSPNDQPDMTIHMLLVTLLRY
jgi:hypothetical protein